MIVLSIGTDRRLFEEDSAVRFRSTRYGEVFTELHIVVFAVKSAGLRSQQIAHNVWIYPTNSLSRLFYVYDAVKVGRRIIDERKFDPNKTVISSQDPFETGKAAIRIRKFFDAGLQIQVHTDIFSPYFSLLSLINKMRVRMAKGILPEADAVRVVSERVRKSIQRNIPTLDSSKIDVLPIYTDQEKFIKLTRSNGSRPYAQFSHVVTMISRLAKEKNIVTGIRAFARVLSEFPKAGLVIVGSGPEEGVIRTEVGHLGIADSVVFEPWQTDLREAYRQADVFLATSLYEGYGLTLVEAGLAGLPIVTSDVGIAGEILIDGKNACVCPAGDVECFSKELTGVLRDPAWRAHLGTQVKSDLLNTLSRDESMYFRQYGELMKKAVVNKKQP